MQDRAKLIGIAARFGCTVEQLQAQYQRNAAQLAAMADKAERAPNGTYRGYTAAELRERAARYEALAKAAS